MTKDQLIKNVLDSAVSGSKKAAEDAIDEYAKQESIAFCLKVIGEMKLPIGMTLYKEDSTESQLIRLPSMINKKFELYNQSKK